MQIEDLNIDNCHNTLWRRGHDESVCCIRKSGSDVKTINVYNKSDDTLFYIWNASSIDAIKINLKTNNYSYAGKYQDIDWESYLEEVKINGV